MEKLKNIKIAFIDIDGTLSNSEKKITSETIKAIKEAKTKGLQVILCSGRSNRYVYNMSKIANASNYFICCNGAEIYDYNENKYIYYNKMDFEDIKKVWYFCKDNGICCILNSTKDRYCNEHLYIEEKNRYLIDDINIVKDIDIYQIITGNNNYDSMYRLSECLKEIENLKITNASNSFVTKNKNSNHYFLDIDNKDVSKGNAIKKVLNYFNLTKENAIGFGDHINDFDLFNEVGFKIAMNNASTKLKDKADFITLSNDENGVAYFLNNYIDYEQK